MGVWLRAAEISLQKIDEGVNRNEGTRVGCCQAWFQEGLTP